jgi:predicted thioredoxin/glutaredoxin
MSKHKKTRKEKIVADYRHQVYILKNKDINVNSPAVAIAVHENGHSSSYVLKDLLKTGVLTFSIIAAEIIFYFLLKAHAISIPNLNY